MFESDNKKYLKKKY